MSYRPKSSMPVAVFNWLLERLSHLAPQPRPGRGGNPGISLEQRLDAFWLMVGDGLSYRKVARIVGISKSAVGDSIYLLTSAIGALGFCQPDGTFITSLEDLATHCNEMYLNDELVCVDGMGIPTQRPYSWPNQYELWDHHHHQHGVHAVVVATVHGDVLWVGGG